MLDIRLIREKPDFVRERLATRGGGDEAKIAEVLRVWMRSGARSRPQLQRLQADRNRLSKEIGVKSSRNEPSEELEGQVRKIGEEIGDLTQRASAFDEEQRRLTSWKLRICRMTAFQSAKIQAPTAWSAVGVRNLS